LNNFVEDFSVTTNALGTPKAALEAAKEAVSLIDYLISRVIDKIIKSREFFVDIYLSPLSTRQSRTCQNFSGQIYLA
jgi:hypothetical protein